MKLGQIESVDLVIRLIQYQMRIVIKESVNAILDTSPQKPKTFVITIHCQMFGIASKRHVLCWIMTTNLIATLEVIVNLSFSAVPIISLRYINIKDLKRFNKSEVLFTILGSNPWIKRCWSNGRNQLF